MFKRSLTLSGAALAVTASIFGQAFRQPDGRIPMMTDWSTKHVIYTSGFTSKQVEKMRDDPRLYYSWLMQGHAPSMASAAVDTSATDIESSKRRPAPAPHRDWAFSLGTGTVAQNMSPAKYSYDINATPSCTNDYAVYGLNVAGSTSGQANLVGLNNLYAGSSPTGICSSGPSVYFAYNVTTQTSGKVLTSPLISEDGKKIIFVESYSTGSVLHVLLWNSSDGGTVSKAVAPTNTAANIGACTAGASCLVSIALGSNANTNSSPFYDYADDIVYVGDDGGQLYKVTLVLNSGTPVVTKLSTALSTKLTGPVYDFNSTLVFVGGANGKLYAVVPGTMALAAHSSIQVGDTSCSSGTANGFQNNSLVDAPIVDSTNGIVFETATTGADGTHTVVVQASTTGTNSPTGTSWTATETAEVGEGDSGCDSGSAFPSHSPAFDNTYYTTPASGYLFACGRETSTSSPELWSVSFTTGPLMKTATALGTTVIKATNHAECSPLTEFDNTNTGADYLFLGEGLSGSFGSLYGFTVNNSTGLVTAISGSPISYPEANGGTSGIIIDNVSNLGQASSLYFTTLGTGTPCTTGAYCAIKLTQSALQ